MPARFSYKNDSDEDRANPQKEAARRLQEQEQQSGSEYASSGIDQLESFANDPNNHDDTQSVREAEDEPAGGWKSNVIGGSAKKTPFTAKAKMFFKKRGALVTILSAFGIGGGLLAGFAGPSSMLIAATQNLYSQNDSSSVSMERRFMKVLGFTTSSDSETLCSSKNVKCKMGRISNKALKQMESKGITAYPERTSDTGYPDKNPEGYRIDVNGTKANVAAKDLPGYLANNPKVAAKILGTGGAFNLRVKAWTSKNITKKFYEKFNIKRDGGIADGKNKASSANERLNNTLKKIEDKIPGLNLGDNKGFTDNLRKKYSSQLEATKKGGAGYTVAVASCMAVKVPGYIASGIAGAQLLQVMPMASDIIMSPGEKAMASGLDKDANFTGDDMSAAGSVLTQRTKSSDGTVGSALDSDILLSAMGINKGKPAVAGTLTPGYSALKNPVVAGAKELEQSSAPLCNTIMSPAAMYTAMAVDSAVTVASSVTIVGGIVKVAVGFTAAVLATKVVDTVVTKYAGQVLAKVAENDAIPKAKGKDLGDVLGISALSYFSAGGMAHNLPTLKKSQMSEFVSIQKETQDEQRQMDIASLSPFDTSSQYTFLGSIIHNFGAASITNNAGVNGTFSRLMGYLSAPLTSLSPTANAANYSGEACDYAGAFDLDTVYEGKGAENTPAINAAGLPCTGITQAQSSMSTDTALSLVEQWLDPSVDVADDATVDELVSSGYVKKDTPLADYINDCSDASTGDYIFNAASCSIDSSTKSTNSVSSKSSCDDDDGNSTAICKGDSKDFGSTPLETPSAEAMQAIPVFLLDYQVHQAINGEDDPYTGGSSAPSSAAGASIDQDHIYEDSTSIACATGTTDAGVEQGYYNNKEIDVRLCTIPNTIDNGPDGNGGLIRVNSRVSGAFLALTEAFISSGQNPYGDKVRFADSFRSMAAQRQVYAQYGSGRAAAPGYSNHQMGLAVDIQLQSNNGATRPGDPTYDWLVANAKKWGITKLTSESWHWQPQAGQGSAVL